jgi:hypothetical protein
VPGLRGGVLGGVRQPGGSIGRLREDVYREAADLAYHFHWARGEIFSLAGRERRVWLSQITRIHGMRKQMREREFMEQLARIAEVREREG